MKLYPLEKNVTIITLEFCFFIFISSSTYYYCAVLVKTSNKNYFFK